MSKIPILKRLEDKSRAIADWKLDPDRTPNCKFVKLSDVLELMYESSWISVHDQQPELMQDVIAVRDCPEPVYKITHLDISKYTNNEKMWDVDGLDIYLHLRYFDYWMPLPEKVSEIYLLNSPWPSNDVIRKLCEATKILLHEKNYDGHGYEQIQKCLDVAEKYLISK